MATTHSGGKSELKDAEATNLFTALAGRQLVREVAAILAPEGILVAPMKGVLLHALACSDPRARPLADVDVLVRERDAPRARELLTRAGFRVAGHGLAAVTLAPPRGHLLLLDLHHRLYPYQRFGPEPGALLARARRDREAFGVEVLEMHPLDLYAHLVGHFLKDRRDARQAQALAELAGVAERLALSPNDVATHLEAEGLSRAARYTLSFAEASGDRFAAEVLARLAPDPLGEALAAWTRRAVSSRPQPAKVAAIPAALLDRTLADGLASLCIQARWAVARTARGLRG